MSEPATVAYQSLETSLALFLIVAASAKAVDFPSFVSTLNALGSPRRISAVVAAVVIVLEFGFGCVAAIPVSARFAPIAIAAVYGAFAIATIYAVSRTPGLNCACLGRLVQTQFTASARMRILVLAIAASSGAAISIVDAPHVASGSFLTDSLGGLMVVLIAVTAATVSRTLGIVERLA